MSSHRSRSSSRSSVSRSDVQLLLTSINETRDQISSMQNATQNQMSAMHATQNKMSAMLSATQDQIAVAQEQMSTIQIENRESMDEVMVRLERLETSPIIQAVAEQDLNPHSNAIGAVSYTHLRAHET